MRKPLGIALFAGTRRFGGMGVADATAPVPLAPVPLPTTTIWDAHTSDIGNRQPRGECGLWALAGLLGLGGLAGLRRSNNSEPIGAAGSRLEYTSDLITISIPRPRSSGRCGGTSEASDG